MRGAANWRRWTAPEDGDAPQAVLVGVRVTDPQLILPAGVVEVLLLQQGAQVRVQDDVVDEEVEVLGVDRGVSPPVPVLGSDLGVEGACPSASRSSPASVQLGITCLASSSP
ncbi:MAG: hypothetical protein HYY06_03230 [Deltaproteobacteria bacterium]|nr:hypothetical protein [Deltaproteobacteria bacterium]